MSIQATASFNDEVWQAWTQVNGTALLNPSDTVGLVDFAVRQTGELNRLPDELPPRDKSALQELLLIDDLSGNDTVDFSGIAQESAHPLPGLSALLCRPDGDTYDREVAARVTTSFGSDDTFLNLVARDALPDHLDDTLTQSVHLLQIALPELAEKMLPQIWRVGFVHGTAAFLSGTALGIPQTILLSPVLLDNLPRLAEHILHEAVHLLLNRSYFYYTPLRRSVADNPRNRICPIWHNAGDEIDDTSSWWDLEQALHAFVVYTHLSWYYRGLMRASQYIELARKAFGTTTFCARYLGYQLLKFHNSGLTPRTARLVEALLNLIPVTRGIQRGVERYETSGVRLTEDTAPGWDILQWQLDSTTTIHQKGRCMLTMGEDDISIYQVLDSKKRVFRLSRELGHYMQRIQNMPISYAEFATWQPQENSLTPQIALSTLVNLDLLDVAAAPLEESHLPPETVDYLLETHVFVDGCTLQIMMQE